MFEYVTRFKISIVSEMVLRCMPYEETQEASLNGFMGLNRPFAAGHSRDTKPPCWRAKSHWDKTNKMAYEILKWYLPLFVGLFHCDVCSPARWFCTT